jgi:hypothetical protein
MGQSKHLLLNLAGHQETAFRLKRTTTFLPIVVRRAITTETDYKGRNRFELASGVMGSVCSELEFGAEFGAPVRRRRVELHCAYHLHDAELKSIRTFEFSASLW